MNRIALAATAAIAALTLAGQAGATVWNGTAYYTYFSDQQVADVTYSYNDATHSLTFGTQNVIAKLPGADGLLFAPGGQNLLVGGQGPAIYDVKVSDGSYTTTNISGPGSYHLALNGSTLYTSGPYGQSNAPLVTGTVTGTGVTGLTYTDVTGADSQVTQLAFLDGKVFYTNSQPNCCGSVGTIDLATGVTTRISDGLTSAHGIVVDPYTGLLDLFGGGVVGTLNPVNNAISQYDVPNIGDFDQGSPDGYGHALIAGGSSITFIDYRASHDITHPDFEITIGGFSDIDDVAPLAGAGSITGGGVPEPETWALMLAGFAGLGVAMRRRRAASALA
ncbi:MAG: PEPxxWA-CTERM sorting domain-containing protein [Phenylobacterium sp.]